MIYTIIILFAVAFAIWWLYSPTEKRLSTEYALIFYYSDDEQLSIFKSLLDYIAKNSDNRGSCTTIAYDVNRKDIEIPADIEACPALYFHTPNQHIRYNGKFDIPDIVKFVLVSNDGVI